MVGGGHIARTTRSPETRRHSSHCTTCCLPVPGKSLIPVLSWACNLHCPVYLVQITEVRTNSKLCHYIFIFLHIIIMTWKIYYRQLLFNKHDKYWKLLTRFTSMASDIIIIVLVAEKYRVSYTNEIYETSLWRVS